MTQQDFVLSKKKIQVAYIKKKKIQVASMCQMALQDFEMQAYENL